MRVVILAVGSRGDVQPYLAFALGLQKAGHDVCFGAAPEYEAFVRARGVDFAPVRSEIRSWLDGEAGRAYLTSSNKLLAFARNRETLTRLFTEQLDDSWRVGQGADAIVHSQAAYAGWFIAEKLRVPSVSARTTPFPLIRAFPMLHAAAQHPLGSAADRIADSLSQRVLWTLGRRVINRWLVEVLQMPAVPLGGPFARAYRQRAPRLYGYSRHLSPPPRHWPDWYHVTGFWFLDRPAGWKPPADLTAFLDAGPPPVYIGFGSMTFQDPAARTRLALDALRRAGRRGILQAGWGGLGQAERSDDVFVVEDVPHDWLFPRMAAVVHHGGAGTTSTGLRAGVPTVVVPFFHDQPYWGARVATLGVGPPPIPERRLTAARLAEAIRAATTDAAMADRVRALAERIRTEDGVTRAVEILQSHAGQAG